MGQTPNGRKLYAAALADIQAAIDKNAEVVLAGHAA
jgi:hypothetical protein